ncbi:MAG: protease complex subunit PrcB family protein, partial [Candidatus Sericytochromatia bacterium]
VKTTQYLLIKNKNSLKSLWNVHSGSRDSVPPDVDFNNYDIIATFMGKRDTTGYSIKINSVVEAENELRVFIDLSKDTSKIMNAVTSPFNMVLVPKVSKNPTFIVNNLIK